MKGNVLSSLESAAHGAKLAAVEVVPHFPAPFSVDIAKKLSAIHQCESFNVESVSSAFSAAIGSSASGKRAFVPASSPVAYEVLTAPFMRLPFVVANVARSQHGVKSDHTSVMALRDSGYIMFFPESNQEIYDTVIQAYRTCEDPKVLLPAVINIDGLSSFSEPVQTSTDKTIKGFLGKTPKRLDTKKPAVLDLYADGYDEFKIQHHKAMENAADVIKKTDEKWKSKFRRSYGLVEEFMTEDADVILIVAGYHSATAREAVKKMRDSGKKVGLVRIRVFRPWPAEEVSGAIEKANKIVVFDQAVSLGIGGVMAAHIKRPVSSLISLGKYPSEKDFENVVEKVEKSDHEVRIWL